MDDGRRTIRREIGGLLHAPVRAKWRSGRAQLPQCTCAERASHTLCAPEPGRGVLIPHRDIHSLSAAGGSPRPAADWLVRCRRFRFAETTGEQKKSPRHALRAQDSSVASADTALWTPGTTPHRSSHDAGRLNDTRRIRLKLSSYTKSLHLLQYSSPRCAGRRACGGQWGRECETWNARAREAAPRTVLCAATQ